MPLPEGKHPLFRLVPAHRGVDREIERHQEAVGAALVEDFHPFRFVLVIEEAELFADELGGGFVEAAVDGDGPVLGDPSPDLFAKVILEVGRRLAGAGMRPLMILLPDPQVQGFVQLF